mgnify:CR=1 FL=1
MTQLRTGSGVVVAAALAVLGFFQVASAVSAGGGSVQGYSAESPLNVGTVVQLSSKSDKLVKPAVQAQLQNMFGVVVDRNVLPLSVSNEGLKNETFVAVSGTYNTLVSTQAGPIKAGDYLTLSSVEGVAMKAGTEEKTVLGRATAPFDGKGITVGSTTLKDDAGKQRDVQLGSIPTTINIQRNPNEKSTKVEVPDVLKRIGQQIAEKEVNPIRIYLSLAITVLSVVAAIVIIYSGIRNSLISIGRNPMSKKSIFRALLEIILTSILVLSIGLFAVYLLLKL